VNKKICLYCLFRSNEGYCWNKNRKEKIDDKDGCFRVEDYFGCDYFETHPRYIDYPQEIGY